MQPLNILKYCLRQPGEQCIGYQVRVGAAQKDLHELAQFGAHCINQSAGFSPVSLKEVRLTKRYCQPLDILGVTEVYNLANLLRIESFQRI